MSAPTLKDSLEGWTGFPRIVEAFEPRHARKASTRILRRLEGTHPRRPEPYDLEDLYRRVSAIWRRDQSLDRIAPRDLRRVPWILFFGPSRPNWLGADRNMVTQFGQWLSGGVRSSSVRSLLHEFLRIYPAELDTFENVRRFLSHAIGGSESLPPSLLRWRQRCRDFGLLDADVGLSFVSNLVVSASDEPNAVLRQAGLDAGLETSGFLRSGIRKFLPRAKLLLQQNWLGANPLGHLLELLELNGRLRFGERSIRKEIAVSLLSPFLSRQAPPKIEERLRPFFLQHFGDPRLPSGWHNWIGIPDDVRRVMIRWLVERALEEFLALIKETALDRHWRYREAFWRAFLKKNLIDDIWFALGPRAKRQLRRIRKHQGEIETIAALRGAVSGQSVLLLRMPGVTVAEWSHNGSCRFWLDGNSAAPKLYEREYHRFDVMNTADFSQAHYGSPTGLWQDKIADWLRQNTGIRIDRADYFPTRLRDPRLERTMHWKDSRR